jgi:SAM-dependent methyltransferase
MIANPWYYKTLACPDCSGDLAVAVDGIFRCASCTYTVSVASPLSLMPVFPKQKAVPFERFDFDSAHLNEIIEGLDLSEPVKIYAGPVQADDSTPGLLFSQIMLSHPKAQTVLDLGCGTGKRESFEYLGLQYVGIDTPGHQSDIAGDAHFLPFKDAQFDVVFSYAVLEHLYNPFVALNEVRRVLKPSGLFIGMVAQGEPFHDSFFHHTAWGLLAVANSAGLKVTKLWPRWDTLKTLSQMGSYPRIIRLLLRSLNWLYEGVPFLAPRRMMKWTKKDRLMIQLRQAGSICFCMQPK